MGTFWTREEVKATLLDEKSVNEGAAYIIGALYLEEKSSIDYQFTDKHEAVEAYNKIALHFAAFCNHTPEQNRRTCDIFFLTVPNGVKLENCDYN